MANRKKPRGTKFARLAAKRAERLRNVGPDASGNYGVHPWAARGHIVEVAPKELRDNPSSQQFPKRSVTPSSCICAVSSSRSMASKLRSR